MDEILEINIETQPAVEITHDFNFAEQIGVDGQSAYELWLAQGNTGTPEEFIAWQRQPAVDAALLAEKATAGAIEATNNAVDIIAGVDGRMTKLEGDVEVVDLSKVDNEDELTNTEILTILKR